MKIYNTRKDMLFEVQPSGRIAELGVYKGDFAQEILDQCQPRELVLIDLWQNQPIQSGDADGNNLQFQNGTYLFDVVCERFGSNSLVRIKKGLTSMILHYEDDYFDMVYIDADHSFDAVREDLENAFRKTKNGGLIMGHDYEYNLEKTRHVHYFGVKAAVTDFCLCKNLQIDMKAMDGCVSFGIRVKK